MLSNDVLIHFPYLLERFLFSEFDAFFVDRNFEVCSIECGENGRIRYVFVVCCLCVGHKQRLATMALAMLELHSC